MRPRRSARCARVIPGVCVCLCILEQQVLMLVLPHTLGGHEVVPESHELIGRITLLGQVWLLHVCALSNAATALGLAWEAVLFKSGVGK